jgi:uncharacterized protein (TIGR03118 family)
MRNCLTKLNVALATVCAWLAFLACPALGQYRETTLTGYLPGMGHYLDRKLNGWGMVVAPDGSFCVANTATGVGTFYDQSGRPLPAIITVPGAPSQPFGPLGTPTGLIYNPTTEFVISKNGRAAPAIFIFDSLDGTISGWNPAVDQEAAVTIQDNSGGGSLYTGLALGWNSHGRPVLYAANWGHNSVDMLDGHFNLLGSFTDPNVPGELPLHHVFGVDNEDGKLYVTWGAFSPPFGGVVDIFDTEGNLLAPHHFAFNTPGDGPLVNPWAIAFAPRHFGKFSNALLIGNVEDGKINAFDPNTAALLGPLTDKAGEPIVIPGLWELIFGGPHGGRPYQLFFNAGPNAPDFAGNGRFGVIRATGPKD